MFSIPKFDEAGNCLANFGVIRNREPTFPIAAIEVISTSFTIFPQLDKT